MIDRMQLKFGTSTGQPNLEFDLTPVTVIVGPNNSGKSTILSEIESYIKKARSSPTDIILDELTHTLRDVQEIEDEIVSMQQQANVDENFYPGNVILGRINPLNNQPHRIVIYKERLLKGATSRERAKENLQFYFSYLTLFTIKMDGNSRLNILNETLGGDLQRPTNILAHLFVHDAIRIKVRRIIHEAFGKYFVIDPTNYGNLRVRFSEREPANHSEERSLDSQAINFHKAAVELKHTSDGTKAFSGIITALLAGDPKVFLIDEAEAFLHPSLSNKLGLEVCKAVKDTNKRLIVSTHSSHFLMGCIQSGVPLNILRLTYKNNIATARLLKQDKILHLMRHPLLRSTGVLNGLFYEHVIVTEADSDRAFYQEINERLLQFAPEKGIQNCLFLNAQNKQTVHEIMRPLREIGVPCAAIVDVDVIKDGGTNWSNLLRGYPKNRG